MNFFNFHKGIFPFSKISHPPLFYDFPPFLVSIPIEKISYVPYAHSWEVISPLTKEVGKTMRKYRKRPVARNGEMR